MDDISVTAINIDGKSCFLVDSIGDDKNVYNYFVSIVNNEDIYVLKDKIEDNDSFYIALDNENEFDYAMSLFYEKYGN